MRVERIERDDMANEEKSQRQIKLEKKIAQAEARLRDMKARERKRQRKLDTRKKIIIGGLVIAEMKKNDEFNSKMEAMIENGVTQKDHRKVLGLSEIE